MKKTWRVVIKMAGSMIRCTIIYKTENALGAIEAARIEQPNCRVVSVREVRS